MAAWHNRDFADRIGRIIWRMAPNLERHTVTNTPDILCIGDLDVDLFIALPAIPGFDQKVAGKHLGQKPGGMAANAAVAMTRLGRPARLLAAVGDDHAGEDALKQLAAEGVDTGFIAVRPGTKTFMCVILLSPSGEKSLIRLETDAYLPRASDFVPAAFRGIRHMHMTYGNANLTFHALEMAKQHGISTSLDLEPPDIRRAPEHLARMLKLVDTLFLNSEAFDVASEVLGGILNTDLLRRDGEIIVTMGAAGCRRLSGKELIEVPGFKVDAVDTTGAGDCFAGAYLASRWTDASPRDALAFANAAAALATLDFGAQAALPQRQTVEAFLRNNFHPSSNSSTESINA
jgi:ribokinase